MSKLFTGAFLIAFLVNPEAFAADPIRPDPKLTPGDVLTTNPEVICQVGYTKRVRSVTNAMKREVFRRYHDAGYDVVYVRGKYEVDHLVSLELGGSNEIINLWPESYLGDVNAHTKDVLENWMHRSVCNLLRKVGISEATSTLKTYQAKISQDWMAAYQEYVGVPIKGW